MTSNRNDPDNFLMGGSAGKSFKFDSPGRTVFGKVMSREMRQQTDFDDGKPLFWDDGNPKMQLAVELDTDETDPSDPDDDGVRMIYVKGEMQKAVRQAVITASAPGLEVGGQLQVTYTGDGPKPARGNAPKLYAAVYVPAAQVALMGPAKPAAPAPPAAATAAAPTVDPAYAAFLAQQAAAAAPPAAPAAPPIDPAYAAFLAQQAAAAAVPAPVPAGPPIVDPAAAAAALNALTPEQRAALGIA